MSVDPEMPSDESLSAAEAAVERDGGVGEAQFAAEAAAQVHCFTCGRVFPASTVDGSAARRLEGVSDPADMLLVVAVRCPHCGASGALDLGYGPEASLEDAEVVRALGRGPSSPLT